MTVTASVGGFVPKAHTPFQWFGQNTMEELRRKVDLLRDAVRAARGLTAALARSRGHRGRGPRQPGRPPHGCRSSSMSGGAGGTFQEWSEHFDLGLWTRRRSTTAGLTLDDAVYRHRDEDEVLPWDHVSAGLHRDFLWQDWQDALAEHGLEDCRWTPCYDCGACTGLGVEHVVASAVPPAGGSQGTGQDLDSGGDGAGAVPRPSSGTGPEQCWPVQRRRVP